MRKFLLKIALNEQLKGSFYVAQISYQIKKYCAFL